MAARLLMPVGGHLKKMPPSGREGDREAVEGARGYNSRENCLVAGGYRIRSYEKQDKTVGLSHVA